MSINENDLPTSTRCYTVANEDLPEGSRRYNVTVGFPQSHVSSGHTDTIEYVVGPKGEKGDPGPTGPQGEWDALTQAQYDALPSKDPETLYVIVP